MRLITAIAAAAFALVTVNAASAQTPPKEPINKEKKEMMPSTGTQMPTPNDRKDNEPNPKTSPSK